MSFPMLVSFALMVAQLSSMVTSFTVIPAPSRRAHVALSVSNADIDDLDKARIAFEQLVQDHNLLGTTSGPVPAHPQRKEDYTPPPLTECSRARREVEMELLESLEDSDDAIDELMSLWLVERDYESALQLKKMETICSDGLQEEERLLRQMIMDYGIHWAEPVNRLAAVLYYKGQTLASKHYCNVVLAVKPWHFEAVQTQVMNSLREQDLAAAVRWARLGLPPLNPNNGNARRRKWVQRALADAQESLQKAEQSFLRHTNPDYIVGESVWQ